MPSNSLAYALETNYWARTNAIKNYDPAKDQPWLGYVPGSTNVGRYRLNTNSVIYGKRGATAISVAQFGGTQARVCLITRRHAVTAGHYREFVKSGTVWFLGTNNTAHGMTIARSLIYQDKEDRAVFIFTRDVPGDVQPMRIAAPLAGRTGESFFLFGQNYFAPDMRRENRSEKFLYVCQHGYCGYRYQPHAGGVIGNDSGDSGSPGFMLLGDECVNVGGISMSRPSTNLLHHMDELTRSLGLDPAHYQPDYISLTNYPTWPTP